MKRHHTMPFGAVILGDEGVCFRLWAPAARRVDVALEDGAMLPMSPRAGGWFELSTGHAGAGSLYRYRIDGGALAPDPASRCNPADVHGPSLVVDPLAFNWQDAAWRGRPWEEAVIYELHVGAFTPQGSFAAAAERLDYLAGLGVTAIELMPVADFPGARNWGYDGVLPFAPDSRYGRPDDLKALIQAAHARGLMVFLDVVYNHFGPEGNYLHLYAPQFFTGRQPTPWGAAINFDGPDSRTVRDFFIHNALYWLEEFHFDGLRLDAVHAIRDDSRPHILTELARAVGEGPGRERHVHLMLENDGNDARYLRRDPDGRPQTYAAQWNDDTHHALHVLLTGETDGYYADYGTAPAQHLGRCLAEGYAYQGEPSAYRGNRPRGAPSADLPATAFVNFLQSHDQIGNRAFGERLAALATTKALKAAAAVLLLAPSVPLLFMGEEFGCRRPFLFFCDFGPELAAAVTAGRRNEFARPGRFAAPAARERIPDPNAAEAFLDSRLDWNDAGREDAAAHQEWLSLYRQLLALRRAEIVPRLHGLEGGRGRYRVQGRALSVSWILGDGSTLILLANLGGEPANGFPRPPGKLLYATHPQVDETALLPPWAAMWFVERMPGPIGEPTRQERGNTAQPRIPSATYRLQFNCGFTFAQAAELVPYLHELGVSHCYASPYLKARPGSAYGYDIIDHGALNPELGDPQDFERFVATLHGHGMGQILDIVPNHMGVMGSDNAWWLDVLENGQAAAHAGYFDIDWCPIHGHEDGKILVPVLGDHYGAVLEKGELKLAFDAARGEFSVLYYHHRFPVDPREYPFILGLRPETLEARVGAENPYLDAFRALITAFSHLPTRCDLLPSQITERNRDKEVHKRHLAELCTQSPDLAWFVGETVDLLNGTPGKAESFDGLHGLLEAQTYRLANWRVASDEINYRRFFDINELAGLRMDNRDVFEATHRLVFELLEQGKIDGLRVDHPDGLYDPLQYLRWLRERSACYLVVEKILAGDERLPEDWPVHGTTGYDFASLANGLLVRPGAAAGMARIYASFLGGKPDFDELLYRSKRLIIRAAMAGELNVLAHQLSRIAQADRHTRDYTINSLRDALTEIVASFPVYRTYITVDGASPEDRRVLEMAVEAARQRSRAADVSVFEFVCKALLATLAQGRGDAERQSVAAFAMKFQQYTAPVMAKGMEDTGFYQYHRLISLNEVGGDPRRFGVSLEQFHSANAERARRWPHAMLATSTHDSKRSEDVRARIDVLTELSVEWRQHLSRWSRINRTRIRNIDGTRCPSRNDEYLLYQTLLGAWPLEDLDDEGRAAFRERIERYMLKAVREAKQHSSWINPNAAYEEGVQQFVRAIIDPMPSRFLAEFLPFQRRVARFGLLNSLSLILLKLAAPGVPDIYQGNETWNFSLVDPDNRRPVDFELRRRMLQELQALDGTPGLAGDLLRTMEDGRVKMYLTWKALSLRRQHESLFRDGKYLPLRAGGERAEHLCAFARKRQRQIVLVVAARWFTDLSPAGKMPLGQAWTGTWLEIPAPCAETTWFNAFTGEKITAYDRNGIPVLDAEEIFRSFTCGLLLPDGR